MNPIVLSSQQRQRGAKSIEFALVFPLFFALFYAILMYGFAYLAQLTLQHAAEDGARAALEFPGPSASGAADLAARQAHARAVATQQASWLAPLEAVEVSICAAGSFCSGDTLDTAACTRESAYSTRCAVVVTLRHAYGSSPVVPSLPGLKLLLPASLQGSARSLLDGRSLPAS